MSILPKWYNGRVCIPWWYGLGYACVYITIGLSIGIKIESETMIAITTASAIAMMVASLIGAIAYVVLYATSKYQKQKADAEELKARIVASGKDPDDLAQLSVAEKWEITKCRKFDRMFILMDILWVLLGAGFGIAVLYFFGGDYIADEWEQYAVAGFFAGLALAWIVGETLIKTAASGEWSKKAADAFRVAKAVVEETVLKGSRRDELIAKFVDEGFSKKEAQEMAKQAILDELKH